MKNTSQECLGEDDPPRVHSECKGPEARACLGCSRKCWEHSVARVKERGAGDGEIWGVICDVSMNEHCNYLMKTSIGNDHIHRILES